MSIEQLLGKTLSSVEVDRENDIIKFIVDKDESYSMLHLQDCCEDVRIDDINGDVEDLVGSPITLAKESTNSGDNDCGSFTWTFYTIATVKGYVDIKWYGSSNGYYSEAVYFCKNTENGRYEEW